MDKLPPEVLHRVFIELDLEQRLVCTLVCRSCLVLKKNKDQFKRIMDMFKQSPDHATQVEKLDIELRYDYRFDRRKLLNIFPNVRLLNANAHISSDVFIFKQYKKRINITHSKSKLEYLSDFCDCDLACQVISSNLGGRLKTLCLSTGYIENTSVLISQLKDLPVLKTLYLQTTEITLHGLEAIHKNIPSIQDFTLQNVRIKADSMPSDILPASAIIRFILKIRDVPNARAHSQFYQYLTKKYINITDIEYEDPFLHDYEIDTVRQIYLDGILDFFKLIGPNMKTLVIDSLPGDINPFEVLDKVDSQINKVRFRCSNDEAMFQYLSQSNQFKCVKELDVININFTSILPIRNMTALTKLYITYIYMHHRPICLADCLSACPPSLKNLTLEYTDLLLDAPFKHRLDSIEILKITVQTLTNDLCDVVSSCFPNLVELTLEGRITENVNLTLEIPRFQKVTFCTRSLTAYEKCVHGFSFKSPSQTQPHHCIRNRNKDACTPRVKKRVKYYVIKGLPILSVVFLTEAKLELGNDIDVIPC